MNKKKPSIVSPILWTITTALWVVHVCVNSTDAEFPPGLLAFQCATAIVSAGAAVANFIRCKRSNKGE